MISANFVRREKNVIAVTIVPRFSGVTKSNYCEHAQLGVTQSLTRIRQLLEMVLYFRE